MGKSRADNRQISSLEPKDKYENLWQANRMQRMWGSQALVARIKGNAQVHCEPEARFFELPRFGPKNAVKCHQADSGGISLHFFGNDYCQKPNLANSPEQGPISALD